MEPVFRDVALFFFFLTVRANHYFLRTTSFSEFIFNELIKNKEKKDA